ncbi:hypothetical protein ABGT15_09965 [Flavobacterium enshiense]|uniref:hypothetical protein n=1 Tax=Flavobacterium enshiense TaxID=1341165 RepID=UPI00345C741F
MRNAYIIPAVLLMNTITAQVSGVGIGTTNPQQKLHLDNSIGTMRVENLDKDNNEYNGGNAVPTGSFPLYVDNNGVLTLGLIPLANSDGLDAINHLTIPQASVTLSNTDADGKQEGTILSYDITVTRNTILEIKYSVSFETYFISSPLTIIKDGAARRISTYYVLNNQTRRYGQASKSYLNNNGNNPAPFPATQRMGAVGPLYNSSSSYIQLTPGTHNIKLKAEVSSGLPSMATHVKLAMNTDSIFMRMY